MKKWKKLHYIFARRKMVNSICKGKCVHGGIMKIAGMELDTRICMRGSFRLGYKRCRKCEYFIKYDGNRCPCCNGVLKIKPRSNTARRNLREYNEKVGHFRGP